MRENKQSVSIGIGLSTFMMIFTVLCMMVFATLAYLQAQRNENEAEKIVEASQAYYAADYKASQLYQEIKEHLDDETYLQHLGIQVEESRIFYQVKISDTQTLQVTLEKTDDGLQIEQWQEVVNTDQQDYAYQGFVH